MLDAISAEALKFRRHRATWGLVWIWPIGIILSSGCSPSASIWPTARLGGARRGQRRRLDRGRGRLLDHPRPAVRAAILIGAFVAVVFAGEYGWNTWKLIVPHRARNTLIAAKYVVALALLACGFALAAILFNALGWVEDIVTGDPIPAGIAAGALLEAHGLAALAAIAPLLLTAAYVSLAAILTRSTVGALVIGLVITTLEQLFRLFAPMLESYAPALVGALYRTLPGYHLGNLDSWLADGRVLAIPFPSGAFSMAPTASLAIVAAWIFGLTALTFRCFRRQDIN